MTTDVPKETAVEGDRRRKERLSISGWVNCHGAAVFFGFIFVLNG